MKTIDLRNVVDYLASTIPTAFPGGIFYGWTKKDDKTGVFCVIDKISDDCDGTERVVRMEMRICLPDEKWTVVDLDTAENAAIGALAFNGKRAFGDVTAYKCVLSPSVVTWPDEKGRMTRVRDFVLYCLA